MKDPHDIIIRPVISEKSYSLIDQNKYTFIVDPRAAKTEIRQAVEQVFNVRVTAVNTIKVPGKPKRQGWSQWTYPRAQESDSNLGGGRYHRVLRRTARSNT